MIPASPAFQPDRGAGGFQLAADRGFQTQTPSWVGDLGLALGLDSPTAYRPYLPAHAVTGDLRAVLGLTAVTTGPRRPPIPSGGGAVWIIPRRYHAVGDLALVAALDARTARRLVRRYRAPAPDLATVVGLTSRVTARDYVRDVLIPEDDELLMILS